MRTLTFALVAAFAANAQEPATPPPDVAWRELIAECEPVDRDDVPDPAQQIELLREFVREYGARSDARDLVLRARCRLGSLHLARFDAEIAESEYDTVRRAAGDDLDLRGRALYGLAQAYELGGDTDRAEDALDDLVRDFAGTRYGRWAEVALRRVRGTPRPRAGDVAPEFGPRLDIDRRARSLGAIRGAPVLLAFWSPGDRAGLERLAALCKAAIGAGLDPERIVHVGLDGDPDRLRSARDEHELPGSILAGVGEFLEPVVLDYGVRALPATILVGHDGRILARDLTRHRLQKVVRSLVPGRDR